MGKAKPTKPAPAKETKPKPAAKKTDKKAEARPAAKPAAKTKAAVKDLSETKPAKNNSKTAPSVVKDKEITEPKIKATVDASAANESEAAQASTGETLKMETTINAGDPVKYVPTDDERQRYEIAPETKIVDAEISMIIDNKVTVKYKVRGMMDTQTGANYSATKEPGTWHMVTD